MPLYDYACDDCGPFMAWSSMSEADQASACPHCGCGGGRQVAAPHLSLMNGTLRKALGRSERSADEPRVVPRKHLDNCGCTMCAGRRKPPSVSRRWMIGH
jgi:putative FmdB family regulatory protein